MPCGILENNSRLVLRVHPDDKVTLERAAAIEQTDMADFILSHALEAAGKIIKQAEDLTLSERDSLRVLDALENPSAPNAKILTVAHRLPRGE